jgi:hypothetical protein
MEPDPIFELGLEVLEFFSKMSKPKPQYLEI